MTLIYFILILGIIVLIHEFGHFFFAKRAGIYVYEFSIGMGPRIHKWTRKNDETEYSLRLIPIGGYVQMAGEEIEDDKSVPKDKKFSVKTFGQKFMTVIAGIMNNFLLAIILLFFLALFNGAPQNKVIVGEVSEDMPAYSAGLQENDKIVSMNGKKIYSNDIFALELQVNSGKEIVLGVERDGEEYEVRITPVKKEENGVSVYRYGFAINDEIQKGFFASIKYGFSKTISLLHQMILTIWYLITGALSFKSFSGPVGIYNIVGQAKNSGFWSLVSLTALLSVNVGFINLLPLPAFDGGRLLFIIIEKLSGKKIDPKLENTIHTIGFFLLMALMILVTYNDIIRLIK
ncbi:MAG: RIP metalloprotease RseP [Bacilli bacterium]|nr:RIP metalloprotease RseP [Bacilli bacterium]MBR3210007.1 RIP metalloprotease RseP [Bacilli bacterium]